MERPKDWSITFQLFEKKIEIVEEVVEPNNIDNEIRASLLDKTMDLKTDTDLVETDMDKTITVNGTMRQSMDKTFNSRAPSPMKGMLNLQPSPNNR